MRTVGDISASIRTCSDCRQRYEILAEQVLWYRAKGFVLPKRCASCRALRREARRLRDGEEAGGR